MANPGEELSSIDFESMIGGPLSAVIRAQTQAANTSVDFIKSVGFTAPADGGADATPVPTMVTFDYEKPVEIEVEDEDGSVTTEYELQKHRLSVPFLAMVPIPFIRIEETTIDFNAKITSVQFSKTMSQHDLGTSLSAKAGWGPFSAKLKVDYSYKRKTSSGSEVNRTYALTIHVRAVQDELPPGTEKLLGILEGIVQEINTEDEQ